MVKSNHGWCAVRGRFQAGFSVSSADLADGVVYAERGERDFGSVEEAEEDAARLTGELDCAQWEFIRLVNRFREEAESLACDQRFFRNGVPSDVRDDIWNAVGVLESLARNMVASEPSSRRVK